MDGGLLMAIILVLALPAFLLFAWFNPSILEDNRIPPDSYTGKRGGRYYLKTNRRTGETYRKYY